MTRTLKSETQIKNIMNAFIAENGVKNTDVRFLTGERYVLVTPNRFSDGYITYVSSTGEVWSADLKRKDPTSVRSAKEQTFNLVEKKKYQLTALRNLLKENFLTLNLDEMIQLQMAIKVVFDWLVEHEVEVE